MTAGCRVRILTIAVLDIYRYLECLNNEKYSTDVSHSSWMQL